MADRFDRSDNESTGGGSFVMGLLAGTVLGAGLGMMFAPKAGAELRSQLSEQAGNLANTASEGFDTKSALEIARIINAEDAKVAAAVKKALPEIAITIDAVARALRDGGRLIYVGAGSSGRISSLDASFLDRAGPNRTRLKVRTPVIERSRSGSTVRRTKGTLGRDLPDAG